MIFKAIIALISEKTYYLCTRTEGYEWPRGQKSPILLSKKKEMLTKEQVREVAEKHLSGTGIFMVDVRLSSTGRITVLIDRPEGVTIDDCAMLSRQISSELQDEIGNYELNVSSPGLDMPLLVPGQYTKNEGRMVSVTTLEGEQLKGVMRNVTRGGFDLEITKKEKRESITTIRSFNFEELKTVKVIISFK